MLNIILPLLSSKASVGGVIWNRIISPLLSSEASVGGLITFGTAVSTVSIAVRSLLNLLSKLQTLCIVSPLLNSKASTSKGIQNQSPQAFLHNVRVRCRSLLPVIGISNALENEIGNKRLGVCKGLAIGVTGEKYPRSNRCLGYYARRPTPGLTAQQDVINGENINIHNPSM